MMSFGHETERGGCAYSYDFNQTAYPSLSIYCTVVIDSKSTYKKSLHTRKCNHGNVFGGF